MTAATKAQAEKVQGSDAFRITKDTPVGFEMIGVKKKAAIQLMGSRLWGRFNPNHWDPVYAAETGLKAPIQTGEMSSAYIAEMCVNYFGADFFIGSRMQCKYVASTFANETITRMAWCARRRQRARAIASRSSSGPTMRRARSRRSAFSRSMSGCGENRHEASTEDG
jgi:hypothetical protein